MLLSVIEIGALHPMRGAVYQTTAAVLAARLAFPDAPKWLTIPPAPAARVAKLVDARDLSKLSTRRGNARCEWGQIRGNSTTTRRVTAIPS